MLKQCSCFFSLEQGHALECENWIPKSVLPKVLHTLLPLIHPAKLLAVFLYPRFFSSSVCSYQSQANEGFSL